MELNPSPGSQGRASTVRTELTTQVITVKDGGRVVRDSRYKARFAGLYELQLRQSVSVETVMPTVHALLQVRGNESTLRGLSSTHCTGLQSPEDSARGCQLISCNPGMQDARNGDLD